MRAFRIDIPARYDLKVVEGKVNLICTAHVHPGPYYVVDVADGPLMGLDRLLLAAEEHELTFH